MKINKDGFAEQESACESVPAAMQNARTIAQEAQSKSLAKHQAIVNMIRLPNETDAEWHKRLNEAAAQLMGWTLCQGAFWEAQDGRVEFVTNWSPATDIAQAFELQAEAVKRGFGERFSDEMLRYWVHHVRDDRPEVQWDWRMNLWLLTAPAESRTVAAIAALASGEESR